MRYKALLFAPDGDYVTDYRGCESVDEVIERLADQGSRWFFYPFETVIEDDGGSMSDDLSKTLIDVGPPFDRFKGRWVRDLQKFLEDISACGLDLDDDPFQVAFDGQEVMGA